MTVPVLVTYDLPSSLQVGEPVVYAVPGVAVGGDNRNRMAFVTRLYKFGPLQKAAVDILVLLGGQDHGADTLLPVYNAVYDPALSPGTFCRNDGSGTMLLDVNTMMTVQDPSAGGTL